MKCKYVKDNQECQANAMVDSEFCFFHNPAAEDQRKKAQSKGGQASYYNNGLIKVAPIDLTADNRAIIYLLSDTINRVRSARSDGRLDIKVANSIGFLCGKMIEAQKELELVERMERVETAVREKT